MSRNQKRLEHIVTDLETELYQHNENGRSLIEKFETMKQEKDDIERERDHLLLAAEEWECKRAKLVAKVRRLKQKNTE
jgi:hypothetical protein